MLHANDADAVVQSPEALKKMMTMIVTVFEVGDLTVSKKKTETMPLKRPHQAPQQELF